METVVRPVQNGRGGRRRWNAEQKLAVLQEWKNGVPLRAGPEEPGAGVAEAGRGA
jgi:hypothetical protein